MFIGYGDFIKETKEFEDPAGLRQIPPLQRYMVVWCINIIFMFASSGLYLSEIF